jgi:hypothetical protein
MIINLTKQWRIVTDPMNYILEKKYQTKKGDYTYKSVAYCSNIQNCINALLESEIKSSEVESLQALKLHIDKIKVEIADMLQGENAGQNVL